MKKLILLTVLLFNVNAIEDKFGGVKEWVIKLTNT